MTAHSSIRRIRAASAIVLACAVGLPAVSAAQGRAAPAPRAVVVSFKLDPRVTRSLFMGERWVSPPIYTSTSVEEGKTITVQARSHLLDTAGTASRIRARWAPADPDIVTVTRSRDNEVQLAVGRAGETLVTVSHGGLSSAFLVRTVRHGTNLWRADISPAQPAGARTQAVAHGRSEP